MLQGTRPGEVAEDVWPGGGEGGVGTQRAKDRGCEMQARRQDVSVKMRDSLLGNCSVVWGGNDTGMCKRVAWEGYNCQGDKMRCCRSVECA